MYYCFKVFSLFFSSIEVNITREKNSIFKNDRVETTSCYVEIGHSWKYLCASYKLTLPFHGNIACFVLTSKFLTPLNSLKKDSYLDKMARERREVSGKW